MLCIANETKEERPKYLVLVYLPCGHWMCCKGTKLYLPKPPDPNLMLVAAHKKTTTTKINPGLGDPRLIISTSQCITNSKSFPPLSKVRFAPQQQCCWYFASSLTTPECSGGCRTYFKSKHCGKIDKKFACCLQKSRKWNSTPTTSPHLSFQTESCWKVGF